MADVKSAIHPISQESLITMSGNLQEHLLNNNGLDKKERIIQEYVPGKQDTLAHLIAHPQEDLVVKLGLDAETISAIGIMTITPSEASMIAADVATKAAGVEIGFLDRFSGCLVITGDVGSVEAGLHAAMDMLRDNLKFSPTQVTRS